MTGPYGVEPQSLDSAESWTLDPKAAKGAKAARKAEKRLAKDARRAAKAAAKAARKAEAAAAKAARKAEQARAKADAATDVDAKPVDAGRKGGGKSSKSAAKAEKAEAKARAKTERAEAKARAKAEKAAPTTGRDSAPDPSITQRVGAFAASAGAVLEEVAGLVRQAAEPAVTRILERAPSVEPPARNAPEPRVVAAPAAEPTPDHVAASEPTPLPELEAEPEPTPATDLEGEAEPEPEPAVAAEGGPAPVHEPVLEPEREPAAPSRPTEPGVAPEPSHEPAPAPDPAPQAQPVPVMAVRTEDRGPSPDLAGLDTPRETIAAAPAPEPEPVEIPEGATIHAAIDVGSTSVHLLVAAVAGHRVVPLVDESVFLGLGDRVATDHRMGPAARGELVEALAVYAGRARDAAAREVTIVGTEPMRRAADTATVIRAVEARTGAAFHVIDHDEEGLLTLLGVTLGHPLASSVTVLDVGGGSTEYVAIDPDGRHRAGGLPLGANLLTRELVRFDPPSLSELDALKARVREILRDAPELPGGELVGVGGTVSNLLKLLPATAVDRALTRRRLTVALAMLTVERSAEAAGRHLIRPERARILPAGSIIIDAILEHSGADRVRVSDEGIREGLALAVATAGPTWRDRLPDLARGWQESQPVEALA